MLVVRKAQLEALRDVPLREFELRMVTQVRYFFAERCQELGPDATRALVRAGLLRARPHGIQTERDLSKWTTLVFAFGETFDVDPALPWAKRILTDVTISDGTVRTSRLYAAARAHLKRSRAESEGGGSC